jgi:lantibiotic leader peptide-processing serine protease
MKYAAFARLTFAAAVALMMGGCSEHTPTPTSPVGDLKPSLSESGEQSYVLLASGDSLTPGMAEQVAAAGGAVVSALDPIGVIVATSSDPEFVSKAAAIPGIESVTPDMMVQWVQPPSVVEAEEVDLAMVDEQSHGPSGVGAHESFRLAQWAPDAVKAPAAWNAGYEGAGARVAILDGGIHRTHVDLDGNVDVPRSRSFVPGQPFNNDVGTFWHGTHVAGIVAAEANNIGTVGIAPKATIIGVKVLHNGSGAFSWIINGIVYAATPIAEGGGGAHIINMSLGAQFSLDNSGEARLIAALNRATNYATERGVTVIAAAGNNATDLDHTSNTVFVPAQSSHVLAVSSTGPMGWGLDASVDVDRSSSFTNYGQSAINFAGPGGDFVLPGNAVCQKPRLPTGTITQFCWVFDMVMAPVRGAGASTSTYSWAAGTSMASPAVAAVAALIVGKYGPLSPGELRAKLQQSADDLAKPGNDPYYGAGRVNGEEAVK